MAEMKDLIYEIELKGEPKNILKKITGDMKIYYVRKQNFEKAAQWRDWENKINEIDLK